MAYDDDWSSFMTLDPQQYGVPLTGFQDQTFDWGNLDGGNSYANLLGGSPDYLNFGLSDPYNQYSGEMPTFTGAPNSSPFSGISPSGGDSWWNSLTSGLSGAASGLGAGLSNIGGWLGSANPQGTGSNLTDLAQLSLGGLGLYGNWRDAEEQRAMLADKLALERELGRGRLGLDRDTMSNQREIANERLGLDRLLGTGRLGLEQELGRGQLGQSQQRIDLDKLLGTGRLGLEQELGRGQLGQGQQRIDLEKLLGTGRLGLEQELGRGQLGQSQQRIDLEKLLGTGRLGLDEDRLALERQLGTGQLGQSQQRIDLERQLGLGNLDVNRGKLGLEQELGRRGMDLQEDQFGLGQGVDEMASKAMGMQMLINRGRMTADQVNPWLNMMYTGRQQMFGQDPEISKAFVKNPFGAAPVGAAASMPKSTGQFFTGLDPLFQQQAQQPPRQMATGGLASMAEYVGGGRSLGHVDGDTGGQDDKVNASLSDGEYVFDADVVSALGDGNNRAGAAKLDKMREEIRRHKRKAAPTKIPPKAKKPTSYLGD